MEFAFVVLAYSYAALAIFFTNCLSIPVKNGRYNNTEVQNSKDLPISEDLDIPKDVISKLLKEMFSPVNEVPNVMIRDQHAIVKRSQRGVFTSKTLCANGQCRLGSGDCIDVQTISGLYRLPDGNCSQPASYEDYSDNEHKVDRPIEKFRWKYHHASISFSFTAT